MYRLCLGRVLRRERSRDRWWASSIPSRTSRRFLRAWKIPVPSGWPRARGQVRGPWLPQVSHALHSCQAPAEPPGLQPAPHLMLPNFKTDRVEPLYPQMSFLLKRLSLQYLLNARQGVRGCVQRGLYVIPGYKSEFLWNPPRSSWCLFPDCHTGG